MRKKVISQKIKNYLLKCEVNAITYNDNNIKFNFTRLNNIFNQYLILKERHTGKIIKKIIKNKNINVDISELIEKEESLFFDLWIQADIKVVTYKKRLRWYDNIEVKNELNLGNIDVKVYSTIKNNMTINVSRNKCINEVTELKSIGKNIYIKGKIKVIDKIEDINKVELILAKRSLNEFYKTNLEFYKINFDEYLYSGFIYGDFIELNSEVNVRWDITLQIKDNKENICYKKLIQFNKSEGYEREENRYIFNLNCEEEKVIVVYATAGKNSLAIWYTTQDQYKKTFKIAKGKTLFNDTVKNTKLNEKMVFFESFLGKNYSGNPRYIYEFMIKSGKFKDFTFIWSYEKDEKDEIIGNPIIVKRDSEEYYKYLAESKYWCTNIVFPIHHKREGNVYLQTWHGTPLKKLGFDIEIVGPETLARENFYIESRNWDYLISDNRYSTEIFKRAFKFNKEVIETGYPINDIFYSKISEKYIQKIKDKIGIHDNRKIILYAPTWRDNEMVTSWNHAFKLRFDIERMQKELGKEYILILRMHHLISESLEIPKGTETFVFDMSLYNDIQELYLISDIIITDYSSVFFDYANSKRPILFYAYDLEIYKNKVRGFYLDMDNDLPGPIIKDEYELIESIKNIEQVQKKYEDKYDEFYNKYCSLNDGDASQRIVKEVFGR